MESTAGSPPTSVVTLVTLALALVSTVRADEAVPIAPAEAIRRNGQPTVLVEMVVKTAKDRLAKRGIIYLDSEDDFTAPANLGVAISVEAAARFRARGIADPASHFLGKTIRVRGCVMQFEERPYLPVCDPDQITVVEKK